MLLLTNFSWNDMNCHFSDWFIIILRNIKVVWVSGGLRACVVSCLKEVQFWSACWSNLKNGFLYCWNSVYPLYMTPHYNGEWESFDSKSKSEDWNMSSFGCALPFVFVSWCSFHLSVGLWLLTQRSGWILHFSAEERCGFTLLISVRCP